MNRRAFYFSLLLKLFEYQFDRFVQLILISFQPVYKSLIDTHIRSYTILFEVSAIQGIATLSRKSKCIYHPVTKMG